MVARYQCNGSGDARNAGTDVRNDIGDCKRAVLSGIALLIELCRQRIHAAAAEHAREEHHALRARIPRNAEARNCEQEVGNRHYDTGQPDCRTRSEYAVCHVRADDAADDNQCVVEREELRGLGLRESQSLRKCCVQVINQNRGESVVRKRIAHELESDGEHADRVSHESLVRLNLFNFSLLLFRRQNFYVLHSLIPLLYSTQT